MRIALVAAEVFPFAKTGGLADVCGALPAALENLGHEVIVIMPYYRCVGPQQAFNERALTATIGRNVRVFFLIHKEFFNRAGLYGTRTGDYPDNLDRFSFFCHQALAFLKELGTPFDIVHCHEWQTGLLPVLLKEQGGQDSFFARTRTVFTIHNLAYQGLFPAEQFAKLGVGQELFNDRQLEFYGKINLMKAGIVCSDYVTTVSPQYAREIQTQDFGCWLEGVLKSRRDRLTGILNGLDYSHWDPLTDGYLEPKYDGQVMSAKHVHKARLQEELGLEVLPDIPVFGFVGRLCYQKGLDLLESAFEELMRRPVQLVFQGRGEDKYQNMLLRLAKWSPQKCGVSIRYDERAAHRIYAGSDFFLMPSIYEPCGLTQMISLRYGAIPVTSHVGGLVDTVTDIASETGHGNGIVMSTYSVAGLLEAVDRAVGMYYQQERMQAFVRHGMSCRWTWEAAARRYVECYETCLQSA
ncbi:MAG: glycogen synthase GlgA [Candidatus Omnitrophica bacterium]|nr:glycogen synthase GlgA [Candidatus Omnitrophota bacterium]